MRSPLTVIVVEPTTAVGAELVAVLLEERARLGIGTLRLLGTGDAVGGELESDDFAGEVEELSAAALQEADVVFFAEDPTLARRHAPGLTRALVLDGSGAWRDDPAAVLVSPWVNDEVLEDLGEVRGRIVAGPSAAAAQLAAVLLPLATRAGLVEVSAVSLEAASGAGLSGVEALSQQTIALLNAEEPPPSLLPQRMAFNLLPQVGTFEGAMTTAERGAEAEVRRLLDRPLPALSVTSLTAPVFYAHTQVIQARTERPLLADEARAALREVPFVKILDEPAAGVYPSPALAVGDDALLVGRIRETPLGLSLVSVADNVRFGSALPLVRVLARLREIERL